MYNRFTQEDDNVPNEATNRYNSLAPWHFFTQQVHNVLELAFDEAKHLCHREIGPVQLLLGLIRQEQGLASQVLRDAGVKLENARLEVEKIQRRGVGSYENIPYNQNTIEVFELSQVEAEKLKDYKIDTEHFLLALLSQSEERAIKVLQNLGVSPTQLRNQVFGSFKQADLTASQPISTSANSSGTNPNNAQLGMIDKILEHPEGSEAEVVKNNPGIIDPKLIGSMAAILEQEGNTKGAKVLRGLIAPRTEEATDRSEIPVVNVPKFVQKSTLPKEQATKPDLMKLPPSPEDFEPVSTLLEVQAIEPELMEFFPPSNQDMEKFPYQLLGVSFVNKGDKQAVHNFLRENLDKLNDRFPEALQNWFNKAFPNVGDAKKQEFLKRVTVISDLIRTFDGGVRGINLEIALTGYNIVASILTPTETPKDWADIQNCLGLSYLEMLQGERRENLQQAIACFDIALNFYKKEECPELQNIRENSKKARTELRNIKEESAARHRFGHG
ncbi:Clp protease N-terminal domain-containing protein [Okeania sp. SIO2B3]|uniref:Clp protease N-terminal domain-containing protein n=1 Tax=Okeania sp. SIO2B3 TaxID=2607784 RepID=UPI0013C0635B|nr:Clp protease N-terminal domain-containing protein [Okeania sp. SIO2B3]NET44413.1 hypothetical protein [Okeania sp. SIO2B3]